MTNGSLRCFCVALGCLSAVAILVAPFSLGGDDSVLEARLQEVSPQSPAPDSPPSGSQPPSPKKLPVDSKPSTKGSKSLKSKSLGSGLEIGDGLISGFQDDLNSKPYSYQANYEVEQNGLRGRLKVTATLLDGYHTFSTTQGAGGPEPTVISIVTPGVLLQGPFTPDTAFEVSMDEPGAEGIRVEIHHDSATWTAPIQFDITRESSQPDLAVKINAQVCKDSCIPIRGLELKATFAGFYESPKALGLDDPFRDKESSIAWTVVLSKATAAPGDDVDLLLTANPDDQFHIYKYDPTDSETNSRTLIALTQKAGMIAKTPTTDVQYVHKDLGGGIEVDYYPKKVTFKIPLKVPNQAIPGLYPIQGIIGYQGCTDGSCEEPRGIQFQTELKIGNDPASGPIAASMQAIRFRTVSENGNLNQWIDEDGVKLTLSGSEIWTKFCLAMLGGLILNFMPCVLPVIGLKILGFVSEAGGDRGKSSLLTLTYAAGIISLILGLGLVSVLVRAYTGNAYGWGQQFSSIEFRVLITAFMFSLALSFLGVWEIPIPGFAMSKTSTELSNREGYLGAFFKGLITTILATPCSAPFLGGVFVVALSQPAWVVLLIFFGVGLGMSLPYLAVAVQPSLLSFLPKPGAWMETFKEFLAFPMLLSVVFLVSGFLDKDRMSMLSALMFVWFACWMIGRVPAWAEGRTKIKAWLISTAVAVAGTYGSFYALQPSRYELAWQEYEESKLDALVAEGKTVMIDFTANWCQNCKLNLRVALETKQVKELLESKGIVPMVADLTNYSPKVQAKLRELNSLSIPVLAIYSGENPDHPVVLRDLITESQVITALHQASSDSPSKIQRLQSALTTRAEPSTTTSAVR